MMLAFPLRSKIVAALALVILVTFAGLAWLTDFVVVMPRLREQVGASLSAMATQAQASLTQRLLERLWDLRNSAVRVALSNTVTADAFEPGPNLHQITYSLKASHRSFGWIAFADAGGTVVASSDPLAEGADASTAGWFTSGRLSAYLAEADETGEHDVMMAAPVTAADGRTLGVIAARLNLSWLLAPERATLADHHPLRDGTQLLLLDRNGTVIDGPPSLLGSAIAFDGRMPDNRFYQVVRIGGDDFDVGRAVGLKAPELQGLGWSVVVAQPLAMAARPLAWLSVGTATVAASAGLVLLLCGWVIATRVTQPLAALRHAASRMAAGDEAPPIPDFADYAEVQSISRSLRVLEARMREGERQSVLIGKSLHRKEALLRTIAHDLRSPLTAAMALSETLANPKSRLSGEDRVTVATGCFKAVCAMQDLLDNLLRWTFLQMDVVSTSMTVDVRQLVYDALALSFAAAEAKGVDLITEVPLAEIETDADAIGTVVRNLVNNAIKFTRPGGTVRVRIDLRDGELAASVSDTGVGMSAPVLDALFRQDAADGHVLHTTRGTNGEAGTGLGLILCRQLVERRGGWMAAESVEGAGTTFRFGVPIDEPVFWSA